MPFNKEKNLPCILHYSLQQNCITRILYNEVSLIRAQASPRMTLPYLLGMAKLFQPIPSLILKGKFWSLKKIAYAYLSMLISKAHANEEIEEKMYM